MKILFAGGGTLGPVTPLLAVISELRKRAPGAKVVFVGTPRGPERILVEDMDIPFLTIEAPKLRRYLDWRNALIPFEMARSLAQALRLVREASPDVVVGAGGYTSVPLGLAAKLLGKRLLIHQQDVAPSLSNRLLAPFADAVTVAFESSLRDFPPKKTRLAGNPVRPLFDRGDAAKGRRLLGIESGLPVVLVVGGGTGSSTLNEIVFLGSQAWTAFAELVHITGLEKSPHRPPALERPERYHQLDFVGEDIVHLFAAADVVVSRAGLGTMTELAALSKPVILVPIPDSQQEKNAAYVAERGAGRVFREIDLTPEQLVTMTRALLDDPEKAREMGRRLHDLFRPGAREAVAEEIMKLAKKERR